jgi:putative hydrolase of the HAD superfamily
MIRAVFFDIYGTVAGFSPSRYELQSQATADFGIKVTPEGILKGYGAADAYMNEQNAVDPLRLRDQEGRDRLFAEYERRVLGGSGVEVAAERALEVFRRLQAIPYGLAPFDDVAPAMDELKSRGLTLGLISNIDRDGGELLRSLGLDHLVDLSVTSNEVGVEKPHPDIFNAALSRAGVGPRQAVHVGDQPKSDVEGALGVGMSAVLVDRDGNHEGYARCPRIESLRELPALVGLGAGGQGS